MEGKSGDAGRELQRRFSTHISLNCAPPLTLRLNTDLSLGTPLGGSLPQGNSTSLLTHMRACADQFTNASPRSAILLGGVNTVYFSGLVFSPEASRRARFYSMLTVLIGLIMLAVNLPTFRTHSPRAVSEKTKRL